MAAVLFMETVPATAQQAQLEGAIIALRESRRRIRIGR